MDETATGVTKSRPREPGRGESAIGVSLLRPPGKTRICDRGGSFEAAKTATGVALLNEVSAADPGRICVHSRICDRGGTFESYRGGKEANLR